MKKRLTAFLLLAVLICLFTSCKGNETDIHKQMAAGYGDEENTVIIDPFVEVTAKTTISGDDVSCELFEENGEILGFIMRFSKNALEDAVLSNPDNVYYARVSESDEAKKIIPLEEIQISEDKKTNQYAIKMLYPTNEKGEFLVDFCLAERENAKESLIFCAKSECIMP